MSEMLVSDKARHLYTKDEGINFKLFDQDELQTLFDIKGIRINGIFTELVNGKYVKISKMGDQLKFQTVAEEEAKKVIVNV